ncbi:MAG: ATP-binding cassette domain-containing protein, partial [Thermoflexales bacterium]|nr:ATP-binding cassette domain-containing protein [Thermoflexales bacterium]
QLAPRAFHDAGVVLSIALTFLPHTSRSLARIREAQAVRGHRVRGWRDGLPIFVPLLVSGLERSMELAEAMVARGYGAISGRSHTPRIRGLLLLGLLALLGGWLAWLLAPTWRGPAAGALLVGGGLLAGALWLAGRTVSRTTYRPRRWTARDTLALLGCGLALVAILAPLPWADRATLYYTPYPRLSMPAFDPLTGIALLGLLAPAVLAALPELPQVPRRVSKRDSTQPRLAPEVSPKDDAAIIHVDHLSYTYPGAPQAALVDVSLRIAEGAFVLFAGPSGAGKSTLLRCMNGLVPHFTGGSLEGEIAVAGCDPVAQGPQVLSQVIGFVFQDPECQFVVDRVEDEIAFALENAAVAPDQMQARVEEALDWLELTPLRARPMEALSGGEKQRVAIAAALALRPRVLALDEPTSQLDPQAADQVLQALVRLNRELGLTILLAEHRLERVLPYIDHMVYVPGGGEPVLSGPPREVLRHVELTPPLVTLGKHLGWEPLPLTLQEAQAFAQATVVGDKETPVTVQKTAPILQIDGMGFAYGGELVLQDIKLDVGKGELVALMGQNGSGKTTLLKCIVALLQSQGGKIWLAGSDLAGQATVDICRRVGYLPQEPGELLFAESVADELAVTLRNHALADAPPIAVADLLARLGLSAEANAYPRDLSVGQRQRVALGAVTITRPQVLLLDEPTRGMDYAAKQALLHLLREWQAEGAGILLVTHDVELAAQAAGRVVVLDRGRVVADGPPRETLRALPHLAPQIARLFPHTTWLTVQDALAGLSSGPAVKSVWG